MENYIKKRSKQFYSALFALLTILIILSGIAFYEIKQKDYIEEKYTELAAISELKSKQIYYWREDKIGDAAALAGDPFFISTVDFYFRTRNTTDLNEIYEWMTTLKKHKIYSGICILDKKLNYKVGDTTMVIPDNNYLNSVVAEKKAVISDLYMLPDSTITMDIYIPLIYRSSSSGKTVGLVILRIDPEKYLFKVVSSWPTPSKTSEIVLWRKDGSDSLVIMSRLRNSDELPFSTHYSVDDPDLPIAMAARGSRGIVEGRDYRDVHVLADIREIPNTGWIMVAKTDMNEVVAPLRDLTYLIIIMAVLLSGFTALILGFLWRNQKASFYKKLYDIELEKKALLKSFEFLTKYANDIILLTDRKGNITYSNEKASETYGYTTGELSRMNIKDLNSQDSIEEIEHVFSRAAKEGGLLYDAVHKKKDGTTFPVESSSRFIEIEGTVYFQSIVRDFTEKKKSEEHLFKTLKEKDILLKEVHHRVKNNLQTINSLLSLQASSVGDDRLRRFFLDAQNRIKSMALIHQELYTLNLANINTVKYVSELVSHLQASFDINTSRVTIHQEIDDKLIGIDLAIPLGLIMTEILTNIFKHAFPDNRKGNVYVQLKDNAEVNLLRIADDGIGLSENYDIENSSGLGMQLIYTLADQIDGTVEVRNNSGTEFIIRYNEPEMVVIS